MSLANRYRPQSFDEMVGQAHLVGDGGVVRTLVQKGAMPHAFFYGPPGSGKTTLARIIAQALGRPFFEFNATSLKIDEIRKAVTQHEGTLQKALIFIDEVHRLSKNQQEVLLPIMEEERALIIGASTQNPYYALTAAMRSRAHLFELKALGKEEMRLFLERVIQNEATKIDDDAKKHLIASSSGDLRAMLMLLESASLIEQPITRELLRSLRPQAIRSGSSEDGSHFELTSAMIKSVRGSDIDAALYYLARLIEEAEPPEYIARRLAILASEDIGNANPQALMLAASTIMIVEKIGYPEAKIPLAQLCVYLCASPKSNSSYKAIKKAQKYIQDGALFEVPPHLKTHPEGYLYPHDFGGWVKQEYLQEPLKLFEFIPIGFEKRLKEWHEAITKNKDSSR